MFLRVFALLAAVVAFAGPARASAVITTENVEATLLSEASAVAPGATVTVALRQKIREGWHTYWINPGDSGEPTRIDWTLPEGATAGPLQFPYPERQPIGPLMNFGFKDEAWFLTDVTVPASAQPGSSFTVTGDATWLVCEEICIPEEGTATLTVPVAAQTQADAALAAGFAAARAKLPVPSPFAAAIANEGERVALFLAAPGLSAERLASATFFPFKDGVTEAAAAQDVRVLPEGVKILLKPGRLFRDGATPAAEGVVVLSERQGGEILTRALTVSAQPGAVPAGAGVAAGSVADAGGVTLGTALLFALLGGLILNLMPCVFPVLSMKALSLVGKSGQELSVARGHGVLYTLGVLVSFAAIAGALLALRAAGEEIGWGFQLQSPQVVAGLALLLFAVGLNLSGVFTIGGAWMGAGQALAAREGAGGAFFTGVLAVLVAAPCTAPFMGPALGYAVLQDTATALAVFLALGFGMALPFLVLSFSPALIRALPKPGAWMDTFKQVLAFPMYASAAWLVWVLAQQAGPNGVLVALSGMVLLAFALWIWGQLGGAQGLWRVAGASAAALALAATVALFQVPMTPPAAATATPAETAGPAWQSYTPERLASLRSANTPVFVNLTAAWCITCLLNERVALSSEGMTQFFADRGIAYLKGDWTNRDPQITRLLAEHGRNGVPLYLYYAPGAAAPVVLPQLLTEEIVRAAIGGGT